MISAWEVYLFTRLDVVIEISWAVIMTVGICLSLLGIHYYFEDMWERDDDNKEKQRMLKIIRRTASIGLAGIMVVAFVPSTKEAAVIYLLPKIANNKQVQKVPENFVKLLNTKMEAWIADFEKEKKEIDYYPSSPASFVSGVRGTRGKTRKSSPTESSSCPRETREKRRQTKMLAETIRLANLAALNAVEDAMAAPRREG